jgi:hypothetical protein
MTKTVLCQCTRSTTTAHQIHTPTGRQQFSEGKELSTTNPQLETIDPTQQQQQQK